MVAPTGDRLVREYLLRLEAAARCLPARDRRELIADITDHLAQAAAEAGPSEAAVRNALDALGSPEEVVAAAGPPGRSATLRHRDLAAVLLVLVGGVLAPPVAWLVGVVLLWTSAAWSTGQKWLGTLVWPGGIAVPLAVGLALIFGAGLSAWIVTPVMVAFVVAPVVVAVHLYRLAQP